MGIRHMSWKWAAVAIAASGCAGGGGEEGSIGGALASQQAQGGGGGGKQGAAFTTFSVERGGCLDSANGINCNHYRSKEDVFLSGGPPSAALADGRWTYRVIVPGNPASIADGARGNLSDEASSNLRGDVGGGDDVACRTFVMRGGELDAQASTRSRCAHQLGTGADGRAVLQLFPFDDTANDDGVYQLVLCPENATRPNSCKSDNFQVQPAAPVYADPVFSGRKYYDANANGQYDPGEVGIAGWQVDVAGDSTALLTTDAAGLFEASFPAGSVTFAERSGGPGWMQSGNTVAQTSVTGTATAQLQPDGTYRVTAAKGAHVYGLFFGNLCLGGGGGSGVGYWANRGARNVTAEDFAGLARLHLRWDDGSDADPASASELSAYILGARATNMARMLSAQCAALWLSVQHGDVAGSAMVYAPGATTANAGGFLSVSALLAEADAALRDHPLCLAGDPARSWLETLKNACEGANGNKAFVQPGPESCPAPVFPY